MIKEKPGATLPWPEINRILMAEERFEIYSDKHLGYLLAPKTVSRLSAIQYLCQENHLESVQISTRALTRIETLDPANGIVGVEAGCALRDLDAALFEVGMELGLSNWIWDGTRITVGEAIERGVCSGQLLQGKAPSNRLLGVELVRSDGGIARVGTAGPDLPRMVWGNKMQLGTIAYARFQIVHSPKRRYLLAWEFTDRKALEHHLKDLTSFSSSWERLDSVLSGDFNQKGFLLAQISGTEKEMEQFEKFCPKIASAKREDYIYTLMTFLLKQELCFEVTSEKDALSKDNYMWHHTLTKRCWKVTK